MTFNFITKCATIEQKGDSTCSKVARCLRLLERKCQTSGKEKQASITMPGAGEEVSVMDMNGLVLVTEKQLNTIGGLLRKVSVGSLIKVKLSIISMATSLTTDCVISKSLPGGNIYLLIRKSLIEDFLSLGKKIQMQLLEILRLERLSINPYSIGF